MRFSVIIPTYNRRELLRQTLESVWAQTFTDYEMIVVDDGSTDGTWEYLQSLGVKIVALRQQNAGPGAARNLGAQRAKGEYLAFLDSDDLWFPWTLETFVALIQKHKRPAILSASMVEFHDTNDLRHLASGPAMGRQFPDYYSASETGYLIGAGMSFFRRNCFESSGGFEEQRMNGEDHDLALRLGDVENFVQVTSPITLAWRRHTTSETRVVARTVAGTLNLVHKERTGDYPGGKARALERRRILTRHIRPVTMECLDQGMRREAWKLYMAAFAWHIRLARWKYLFGFPLRALTS